MYTVATKTKTDVDVAWKSKYLPRVLIRLQFYYEIKHLHHNWSKHYVNVEFFKVYAQKKKIQKRKRFKYSNNMEAIDAN